jgi:hypothetical protein
MSKGGGMRLKGMAKVLLSIGAASLFFYGAASLSQTVNGSLRSTLLFLALVGLGAGGVLYLLSTRRR